MDPTRLAVAGPGVPDEAMVPRGKGYWRHAWDTLRGNRAGVGAAVALALLAALAIAAPAIAALLTHHGPAQQDLAHALAPPSAQHWLGSDELGRDTLTRLLYGARVSLGVGFLAVAIVLTVGSAVGLAAGYYGGAVDDVLMRVVDVILSIPAIFLYLMMSILFRPNAVTLAVIIASVSWTSLARLVRAEALSIRSREFMIASRSLGAGDVRLMLRHLLPNSLHVVIVAASLRLGQVVLVEAALDYLGLGIQPPTPSWGNMLSNAQTYFSHSVWLVVLPGAAIFLTVMAASLLGNALRDAFDPRI